MRFSGRSLCIAVVSSLLITPVAAEDEDTDWTDRISLKGDLRLRYEEIHRESDEPRERSRYRARLELSAAVTSDINVVMQIASGADDPVSRNVTFDGGFTTKDVGLDLVYVDWTAADGLHVLGGKMKNPLFRAGSVPLIWDSDLNPEGFALTYSTGMFFGNFGVFSVEERSRNNDSNLYAGQVGGRFALGESANLTVGAGYLGYSNTVGSEPFYNGAPKGNTVDTEGNYVYDYKNTEVFAQFDTEVGDWPLKVFSHWTRNSEVREQDTAVAYGAKIGAATLAFEEHSGLQLGAVGNYARRFNGAQIGVANIAEEANGVQIGLFNYAEDLRGVQIGLLNHVPSNPWFLRWLPVANFRF